ncbi:hypothetical protein ENBRE01_3182 [Enteropsectra breve]|nr:hypothetical protein ENBRE01_3182 [Enteropsectra breve]
MRRRTKRQSISKLKCIKTTETCSKMTSAQYAVHNCFLSAKACIVNLRKWKEYLDGRILVSPAPQIIPLLEKINTCVCKRGLGSADYVALFSEEMLLLYLECAISTEGKIQELCKEFILNSVKLFKSTHTVFARLIINIMTQPTNDEPVEDTHLFFYSIFKEIADEQDFDIFFTTIFLPWLGKCSSVALCAETLYKMIFKARKCLADRALKYFAKRFKLANTSTKILFCELIAKAIHENHILFEDVAANSHLCKIIKDGLDDTSYAVVAINCEILSYCMQSQLSDETKLFFVSNCIACLKINCKVFLRHEHRTVLYKTAHMLFLHLLLDTKM